VWTPTGSLFGTGGRASAPDAGVFVGDPVAVGGQLGDQLLAGGFVGAFLRGRACPPASSPSGGGPGTPALAGLRQPTDQTTII
jgi:hypothetical protein